MVYWMLSNAWRESVFLRAFFVAQRAVWSAAVSG